MLDHCAGGAAAGARDFSGRRCGQFRLRLRAPDGTHIAATEQYAKQALQLIEDEVGGRERGADARLRRHDPLQFSGQRRLSMVARAGRSILYVDLKDAARHRRRRVERAAAKATWRRRCRRCGSRFEPADIVNEVMSFGSPTPVEIAVSGPEFCRRPAVCREDSQRAGTRLPFLRDLQFGQSLDYPTIEVNVDREKAGLAGLDAARRLASAGDGDVVQPLRRAELLGRSEERHRLPGAGRDSAAGGPQAG